MKMALKSPDKPFPHRSPLLYMLFIGMFLYCLGTIARLFSFEAHLYLTWPAVILLIPSVPWALYRLVMYFRHRLFFRVRNRIVFFYTFAGVIPILLILLISFLVLTLFFNNLSVLIYQNELKNLSYRLHSLNAAIAETVYNAESEVENPEFIYGQIRSVLLTKAPDLPDVSAIFYRMDQRNRMQFIVVDSDLASSEFKPEFLPDWLQELPFRGILIKNYSIFLYSHNRIEIKSVPYYLDLFIPFREPLFRFLLANSNLRSFVYLTESGNGTDPKQVHSYYAFNGFEGKSATPLSPEALNERFRRLEAEESDNFSLLSLNWPMQATDWYTSEHLAASSKEAKVSMLITFRSIINHISSDTAHEEFLFKSLRFFIIFFMLMEIASIIIGVVIIRSVTRSVHQLSMGTEELRKGNLNYTIPIKANDELGNLSSSFNSMTVSIQALLNEVAEKQKIQRELEIAKEVQQQFFPRSIPRLEGFSLAGRCQPAREVSGDFFDFILRAEDILDVVLGDISGKGISAALLMASLQSASRAQQPLNHDDDSLSAQRLSQLMSILNRHLYAITPTEKFATMFYARLMARKSLIHYSNAGHETPFLIRRNGDVCPLPHGGTILGAFPEMTYDTMEFNMEPGDCLAIYTDGVIDSINRHGEPFGVDRLIGILSECHGQPPLNILDNVYDAINAWFKGVPQHDDITLVIVRRQ